MPAFSRMPEDLMSQVTSQPLKWHGGKHYLAPWIIKNFPPHTHYVEPFFGGGAVLFAKPSELVENHSEAVNDLNAELMNFWRVLRSPESRDLFMRLQFTPFSQKEFQQACESTGNTSIERAWSFFVRYRQSRQGLGKDFATLSRSRTRRGMNEQVSAWLSSVEGLPEAHARLQRVVLLQDTAVNVIRQQDSPHTFFYLDPPYLHDTRKTTNDYEFEMLVEDHTELLATLSSIQGKFLLSGYPSKLYREWEEKQGWIRLERAIDNKASSRKQKEQKIECLWRNW